MSFTLRAAALLLASSPLSLGAAVSNVLVNNPAADTTSKDTQCESVVVRIDGNTLLAAFFDSGSTSAGSHWNGLARSTDNGATWTDLGTLPPSTPGDADRRRLARSAQTGAVYFASTGFSTLAAIPVFRSTDAGLTFAAPVNAAPGSVDADYASIEVDNQPASPFYGRVYVTYREFIGATGTKVSRSTDGGATWAPSGGVTLASSTTSHGPSLAMLTSGGVGVAFFDQGTPASIKFARSTDGGVTFTAPTTVTNLATTGVDGDLGLGFRTNAYPRLGVNRATGAIYAVYNDTVVGDKGNVYFRGSTDGGVTWSAPVLVPDDGTARAQFLPSIGVAPDGSKILVTWYDRRSDPNDTLVEYWGALGTPSGGTASFGPSFRISSARFAPVVGGDASVPSEFFSDYEQMAADNGGFDVTWSDGRDASTFSGAARKNLNIRYSRIGTQLLRGDANGDFTRGVADVFYLINALFAGGLPPVSACQGDANHDGSVNVADVFFLINFLFAGGAAPSPPC
jgi:hypothetical protein